MRITLPPKRFDDPSDPRFDQIRHKKWFGACYTRAEKLPLLKQAHLAMVNMGQQAAADLFSVDPRELRDYIAFVTNKKERLSLPATQYAINGAYDEYCLGNADSHYRYYLSQEAEKWGIYPRSLTELWDTHPRVYPDGYL